MGSARIETLTWIRTRPGVQVTWIHRSGSCASGSRFSRLYPGFDLNPCSALVRDKLWREPEVVRDVLDILLAGPAGMYVYM